MIYATARVKIAVLYKRNRSQKSTHCMPFIRNIQSRPIYRNRKWTTGCLGLRFGEWREWRVVVNQYGVFWRWWKCFKNKLEWCLCNSVKSTKALGCRLDVRWILWHLNYISIQLFKKNESTLRTQSWKWIWLVKGYFSLCGV